MYGNVCGELIIPKIWCYFNVKAPIYEVVLLEKSSVFHSYAGGKVELILLEKYFLYQLLFENTISMKIRALYDVKQWTDLLNYFLTALSIVLF